MSKKHQVVIAGAGGMGSAVGLLLRELGDFEVDLFVGDADAERARSAAAWIREGSQKPGEVHAFHLPAEGTNAEFDDALSHGEILLDCLPGKEAPRMARLARQHDLHYANLTEHVEETEEIQQIAEGATRGFLLQTGLAPGYVNVLGHGLFQQFCRENATDAADTLQMRVGALTTTARPPHFYGFTWSPSGVATEYVKPATVLRDGQKTTRPSLSERRTVIIDGITYEEDLTSGGAADLPVALAGKVRNLDYKTLRYPGHYAWIESMLAAISAAEDPILFLQGRMEATIPFMEDDLVVIYAGVEGRGADGTLRRLERSLLIRPRRVGARTLKAIQSTTTAGLAESARFLLTEQPQGICLQSQIDPAQYMAGPFVSEIYHR
ncbi:MAG TPA: saccharopine dehydrogenase C-terminal domain-containing protein [Thermoanaerobaculia bacterium]|jgi:saccharopine dehydrogenase-like NADP-dependent oxidoreductase|nr:saccharopine dehydrogenase C-terminal domain-containing protein [Thermoanaerobaculia bacterium]